MKLQQITLAAVVTAAISSFSIVGVQPAEAFTVYTDRTSWQNALGGAALTNEAFFPSKGDSRTLTFDSGVVSTANGVGTGAQTIVGGAFRAIIDGQGDSPGAYDTITWSFPQAITGFGGDWFRVAVAPLETLTVTGDFDSTGNQTIKFLDALGSPGTGFLGVIGGAPFTTITFSTEEEGFGDVLPWQVSKLSFAAASPTPEPEPTQVPEPALLSGFMIVGLMAWKKRKSAISPQ